MLDDRRQSAQEKRPRGRPRGPDHAPAPSVQALDRALDMLDVIAARDGLTLGEIAAAAALPASTAHRILATLERRGYARADAESGLWSIGVGAYTVGQAFVRSRRVEALARPAMRALMAASGETVNLGVLEGREVVFLAQVECAQPLRAYFRPGRRGPAHASGIGKALLAWADPDAAARLFSGAAPERFTPATLTSLPALAQALADARARGWALDDEEHAAGMRCVAAAAFDERAEAVAGVSLSGPTVRVDDAALPRLAALTVGAADAVTRAIGGRKP